MAGRADRGRSDHVGRDGWRNHVTRRILPFSSPSPSAPIAPVSGGRRTRRRRRRRRRVLLFLGAVVHDGARPHGRRPPAHVARHGTCHLTGHNKHNKKEINDDGCGRRWGRGPYHHGGIAGGYSTRIRIVGTWRVDGEDVVVVGLSDFIFPFPFPFSLFSLFRFHFRFFSVGTSSGARRGRGASPPGLELGSPISGTRSAGPSSGRRRGYGYG